MACSLCGNEAIESGKCPRCGSLSRHRELAWFSREKLPLESGTKVLEIGPAPAQVEYFPRLLGPARYTAVDIIAPPNFRKLQPPHRFLEMEMTRLTFSDQCFDVIIANGVFPFVRSDYQAMSQVHRCLKGQGIAILTTEVTLEKTRKFTEMAEENPQFYSEEYRAHRGSEWVYGEDYFERLEAAGFFPHRLDLLKIAGPKTAAHFGFSAKPELLLCFKFRDAGEKFLEAL